MGGGGGFSSECIGKEQTTFQSGESSKELTTFRQLSVHCFLLNGEEGGLHI